jgi:hypothetical protein
MLVTEQAARKAQEQFEDIQNFIGHAVQDGRWIDSVEPVLIRFLLELGYSLRSRTSPSSVNVGLIA